ncbi:hypothetical protein [Streptomyces sclerotialus]|uniref:hypothetical protein n=1 Tax=Streptomyces sclerotialus TaxID=1957 RepID=UPI0034A4079A
MDEDIRHRTRATVGFTNEIASRPYPMDEPTLQGFRDRHALIRKFYETTRDVFMASLRDEADPAIADSVLSGQPSCRGREHHLRLADSQLSTPLFFRTDEAAPGAIIEVQCPGSGWEMAEQLHRVYQEFPGDFGKPKHFRGPLLGQVAESMRHQLGREPIVHHLTNNASRPHGVVYTIQGLRERGIDHFGWDSVHSRDCNFVRGHDFYDVRYNNFFDQWLEACEGGALTFDHPPTPLYDSKVIMAWPFWATTRQYYPDEVRALFPHTHIVTPEGFRLADGTWISVEEYCAMGRSARAYYLKFAGHDPNLNWGSRAVFHSGSQSGVAARHLFERILADSRKGRPWVIQEARMYPESATAVTRAGTERSLTAYTKFSGFYTPGGLAAVMALQAHSRKVHGADQTVVSIVH